MKNLKNTLLVPLFMAFLFSCNNESIKDAEKVIANQEVDTIQTLENEQMMLKVDLYGGAYFDLHLKSNKVNPFTWHLTKEQMPVNNKRGAAFQGHFLCLGRWGKPTPGEIEAGVPHNGQASNTMWTAETSQPQMLIMSNYAPRDGMNVVRTIQLDEKASIYYVKEEIKNVTTIARLNNVVQHATLGPPFLAEATIINSNATAGFNQSMDPSDDHFKEFNWPEAVMDKAGNNKVSAERTDNDSNYCCTYIFDEPYGWVTATNPELNVLMGFIWLTREYPFLDLWQHNDKTGKPAAKGLEFGTTGIGESYRKILSKDNRFRGHNSFELLDACQTVSKSFAGFIVEVESNFKGVATIQLKNGQLIITEKGNGQTHSLPFRGL